MGLGDRVVREIDRLVADEKPTGRRNQHAGHDLDQRRFAGAVVADQPDDLVAPDREVDILQGDDRPEAHFYALEPDGMLMVFGHRRDRHPLGILGYTIANAQGEYS